jgi:hypothetical protein
MASTQSFWPVSHQNDDFWVCMSCLGEVFFRKVPMPDCPACHGVSTYEGFSLEAIRDWGTEELIAKAVASQQESIAVQPAVESATPVEAAE